MGNIKNINPNRSGKGDGLFKIDIKRPSIKVPTQCPKCKTVYSHANDIAECSFCNWKNPKYRLKKEDDDLNYNANNFAISDDINNILNDDFKLIIDED